MKKLILIPIIALLLYSCKKSDNTVPNVATNWLSGKWKRTLYQDTTFDRVGGFVVTNHPQDNELNFIDTNKLTQSITGNSEYSYSISKGTINVGATTGRIYKLIKITDKQIKIYSNDYTTGVNVLRISWADIYNKE